jgi:chitinase
MLFNILLAGISFSSWLAGASPVNLTDALEKRAAGYQNAVYFTNWYVPLFRLTTPR